MELSKRDILDALMIIHRVCKDQTSCCNCPFGDVNGDGICKIQDTSPDMWCTVETPEIWRAFI